MYIILLLFAFLTNPSFAYPSTADVIMVHDMEMINQQRFRMEEINDYNDVKTNFLTKNSLSKKMEKLR